MAAPGRPPLRPQRAELADHRRTRWGFEPSPRPVALRAPALGEGWRVPPNPGSADDGVSGPSSARRGTGDPAAPRYCPSPVGILSNAVPDRPSAVPLVSGVDRNPQHRILVATILRRVREWSDGAPPRCCQMIWSLTGPSPCGIACLRYRPKLGQVHFGHDYFTTHVKMVDQCPSALSPNDFHSDRLGLPRRCRPSSVQRQSGCDHFSTHKIRSRCKPCLASAGNSPNPLQNRSSRAVGLWTANRYA